MAASIRFLLWQEQIYDRENLGSVDLTERILSRDDFDLS